MPADVAPPRRGRFLRERTFRALRHRDYRLYFFGQIVSFTGTWMQSAALMWLVYERTNDPAWPARLLVASVGPTLLLGPWGGALADRIPKRRLVFRTQVAFLLTALTLAGVALLDLASPWWLVAVQLVSGVVQSIDLPARLAFVPELVPREDLINAVSLNSLLFNSARAVGPALAGGVFVAAEAASALAGRGRVPVHVGAAACFLVNAASYAAVLWALARITNPGDGHLASSEPLPRLAGVRYVLARPMLAGLLLLTGVLSVFGWPALSLLPAYTRTALGGEEGTYATLLTGMGAGALVGALLTATFSTPARRGLFLGAGSTLAAAALMGLTLADSLVAAVPVCAGLGLGLVTFLSTGQSTLQLGASPAARGRVMALWAMTLSASAPLGHLFAGELAREYGVVPVMRAMALGVALAAAAVWAVAWRGGWRVEGEG